ncbi:MAG: phosphoribosylaminoimidazolesuccinocarboxamide synthase [Candidatus Cloacimonetes bacterium]|nr:phosphoribosylaminoimidazolesuccinocarboxamide synthase [Candidatus Cloacimonadota bacterium]
MDSIKDLTIVNRHFSGKVRDIYDLGDTLLIVTSDRISAFDVVFPNIIPGKGKILNQISVHFFKETSNMMANHFITDEVSEYPTDLHQFRDELEYRSMLVKKTRVIPFECIVRGYITGSAWKEYKKTGMVNGIKQPENMLESQRFAEFVFTPSTKAEEGHDENISYEEMLTRIDPYIAEEIKKKSIELYSYAHKLLNEKGIILADTKFEFGTINSDIYLIDEMLTPDSSRFWDKATYKIGDTPLSFDKQYIRDFTENSGWNKRPPAPELPDNVIKKTYDKYYEAYRIIVGEGNLKF